jgi:predicted ATPase
MATNIVLTGAMGSGKSTVLKLLKQRGFITIEEPARPILAEQRSIEGEGVPEKDPKLFTQLLLSRAIYQYKMMQDNNGIVIYDRGIPDNIAYAQLFDWDYKPAHLASKLFRYHHEIFVFPAWKEIYTTDDERKMSFELAQDFGIKVQEIYGEYGYTLINVPCVSPEERSQFIIENLS